MDGFGASITDSSANVMYRLDQQHARRRDARPVRARDRLSFLRQPMGSSDFTAGPHYTYDDLAAGQTDYGMHHFSIPHDRKQILPLLRQRAGAQPAGQGDRHAVEPAGVDEDQWLPDRRQADRRPEDLRGVRAVLRQVRQGLPGAGVPIYAVTMQNEPQNRNPNGYPGMDLPVAQEAKLVVAVGQAFAAAGIDTKILGYDHNWSEHPNDIANTPPGQDPETEYPTDLLNSAAGPYLAGTAFHCYSGDQSRQTDLHRAFPDKGIWFTECSGSHGPTDPPAQVFSDTLKWHTRNLVLGVTRNWGKTVVNWNLALDPSGGPHNGGCDTCTGVITVGPGQTVTRNAEYYTLGHLARFVRPGAQRIASTSFGTTGWNGQIMDIAFRNPDGSIALVAHNENDDPRTFTVAQGGESFTYTLPGGALATFTWPAIADSHQLLDAEPMSATASTPDGASNLVDDDATTRWTSQASQTPGQWVQVDLGATQNVSRVVLDTGIDAGDYPRGYTLETSTDGSTWTQQATGAGSGQLTTIDFPSTSARYVRITQTGSSGSWWSVADLRAYG